MPHAQISPATRDFISRYVRSVEQLEILLVCCRDPGVSWTCQKVYDHILSTPQSVQRWLDELSRDGLLEKLAEPEVVYRASRDEATLSQVTELAKSYRNSPVRIIEAIYKREVSAAQSFADAFKIKNSESNS